MPDASPAPPDAATARRSSYFVVAVLIIDAMGIGIIIPVMPDLLRELSGLSIGEAALWGGWLSFVYAMMQFVFSPILGGLSDRFGRRPVLLISLAMLGIDYLIMALAPTLWLLFLGRALAGISGATYATATAYIADVTPKDQRAKAFGLVGAGFGIGFILGPAIGGLMGEIGTRAPFYVAAALSFANFAYGWFVLPESLPPAQRRRFTWARANPLGAFRQVLNLPVVGWFILVSFLYGTAHFVYPAVWSYYTKEAFAWSNAEIGMSLAAVGIGFAIVQGGLMGTILQRFGPARTVLIGLGLNFLCMLWLGVAQHSWMAYAVIPVTALSAIVTPALNGLMANLVADDAQGELQGVLSAVAALTTVISPVLMTQLFGVFTGPDAPIYLPGAPFLAAALCMAIALVPFRIGLARHAAPRHGGQ